MSQTMPLYQCHKKVRAAKILAIAEENDGAAVLHLTGGELVTADAAWLTRNPALAKGGYFVEYQEGDKYTAYSPAAPFEGGYTLCEEGDGTE